MRDNMPSLSVLGNGSASGDGSHRSLAHTKWKGEGGREVYFSPMSPSHKLFFFPGCLLLHKSE